MPTPTIVVADDDPGYLDMIVDVLTDAGFPNVSCTTGREAFTCIERTQPDLVLLDLNNMSHNSGWNTLHLLRLTPSTHNIPILVCTTDSDIARQKRAMLRAQGCDILEKPFDLKVLLEKIHSMLRIVQSDATWGETQPAEPTPLTESSGHSARYDRIEDYATPQLLRSGIRL